MRVQRRVFHQMGSLAPRRRWFAASSLFCVVAMGTAGTMTAQAAPVESYLRTARDASCVRPSASGDVTVSVPFRGTTYPVLVFVPDQQSRTKRLPLVLNLHGSSANGPLQMEISGMREVAQDEGFLVAAPNGALALPPPVDPPDPNGSWAWNVPGVPTTAGQLPPATARDDIRFLSRVIDVVSDRLCGDVRRTYATGHSGGARMTSALACRLSDKIAAIAPNSGLRAGRPDPDDVTVPELEDCRPERPVPVVTFHGQQDVVNPYAGNADLRWGYSVPVAAQTWARINDCRRGPRATQVSEHVTLLSYTRCAARAEVDFYRIADGGHTWPGSTGPAAGRAGPGLVSQEIDASRILWQFFKGYRLPGR